jgi:hypothetical protein
MGEIVDYEVVRLARILRHLPLERALAHLIERPPRILGTLPPATALTAEPLDYDALALQDTVARAYARPEYPHVEDWYRRHV